VRRAIIGDHVAKMLQSKPWRHVMVSREQAAGRGSAAKNLGAVRSIWLTMLSKFREGATPRVHRYVDRLMEQPQGLSMVNSDNRLYTLHLVTDTQTVHRPGAVVDGPGL
jgi:hypothetical protein